MEETKLTVRIPKELVEKAKKFAIKNNTTVTNLIEAYLQNMSAADYLDDAPIVRRLSGSLPQSISIEDYHEHMEEKYGG